MDIKSLLNESQYKACSSTSQYLRIIAGAGTGKTRTLTYRIAYLISCGVKPKRMLAITFTNKAAKEMEERVKKLLSDDSFMLDGEPTIRTFHGFCNLFLKREIGVLEGYNRNFNILDDEDQGQIYKDIFSKMVKGNSKEFTKAITRKIFQLKTEGCFVRDLRRDDVRMDDLFTFDELLHVYSTYQNSLRRQNLLDFDDLLMLTLKILKENQIIREYWQEKYDNIFVDEFQDTNAVQYNLIRLLLGKKTMLTVVGDPDQTIYTWRGANNDIIKNLQRDYPSLETVVLDQNYRSTQKILDAANSLIRFNKDRMEKNLVAANEVVGDDVIYTNYTDMENEAYQVANRIHNLSVNEHVPLDQIAVIYRANYLSNSLEKMLTRFKIPYEVYGGMKFYERAEIKDALAYLRLIVNPDDISFRRMLKAPTKSIGDVMISKALTLQKEIVDDNSLFNIFKNYRQKLHLLNKSIVAMDKFYDAYEKVYNVYSSYKKPSELITAIHIYLSETGFMDYVCKEDKKLEEKLSYTASSSTSKVDNVNEFMRSLTAYFETDVLNEDGTYRAPTLEDFLIDIALQSDQDTMKDSIKVALMTGHVSKGLEFPYVFITGLNDMIFPTMHAIQDFRGKMIEEERRLLYVCVTRAQKRLYISSFNGSNFRTNTSYSPSRFLKELNIYKKTTVNNNFSTYVGNHKPSSTINAINDVGRKVLSSPVENTDTDYSVGDRVIHTSFGIGVVTEVLPGGKIMVKFKDEFGEKRLAVGFKAFRKMLSEE